MNDLNNSADTADTYASPETFAKRTSLAIRAFEKGRRETWHQWQGYVYDDTGHLRQVTLKTFGRSWPQVLVVDGVSYSCGMDLSVSGFVSALTEAASAVRQRDYDVDHRASV